MRRLITSRAALIVLVVMAVYLAGLTGVAAAGSNGDANAQVAELYQLQAAYHRAATIHNPNGLDSQEVIDQRIKDMLSLWTDDGSITLNTVSPPRTFTGKGKPGTPSCAPGSGTLCDFFTHIAGPFQPGNRQVSLSPSFKINIDVHGAAGSMYFECHYFDANTWLSLSHVNSSASVRKVHGRWLFSHLGVAAVGVPYP